MLLSAAIGCKDATTRPLPSASSAETPAEQVSATVEPPRRVVSLVTDPAALAPIADAGGSFAALFGAPAARDTAALAEASPRYATLVATLTADIASVAQAHPGAGVGVRGHDYRLFDEQWLRSPHTRFDLVGLAPRLDRAQLPDDCGDVRLLYRVAYDAVVGGEQITSRLPMTISISLAPKPNDTAHACRADALAWRAPSTVANDPADLGRWLVSDGPLAGALDPARVVLVLTNAQVMRMPAASQRKLGGHAEYQMRAFVIDDGGALVESSLENTPDVARIRGDQTLRNDLVSWLRDPATLDAIDRGRHQLPAKFLARRASSYSPFGLARPANRSFAQLVTADELAALPLAGRKTIAAPDALLRRLDEATCQGCHQVRSVAGFHLVGIDPPNTPAGAALAVAYSPLLASERDRRASLIDTVANGDTSSFGRPLAPVERPASQPPGIGDACELGTVRASVRGPDQDAMTKRAPLACSADLQCTAQRGGFPGGMCQAHCDALGDDAVCGVIAVHPFNDCLGTGAPFSKCMKHVRPIGLARCDDSRPCRDDYVCALTPAGDGACLPPYFLFQLRVDGHPL